MNNILKFLVLMVFLQINMFAAYTPTPIIRNMGVSNTIFIAQRTDGSPGTGTINDPFDGSSNSKLNALTGAYTRDVNVYFFDGDYYFTNTWKPYMNFKVEGLGQSVWLHYDVTNAPTNFLKFQFFENNGGTVVSNVHLSNLKFHGHGTTRSGWTNTVAFCSLQGNFITVEDIYVKDPMGNQNTLYECFAIVVNTLTNFNYPVGGVPLGGNIIRRCVVDAKDVDYPNDYITAISIYGTKGVAASNILTSFLTDCYVVGRSHTNMNTGYSGAGNVIISHNGARDIATGYYHELQSGGAYNGDNGEAIVSFNRFDNVNSGIWGSGFYTNRGVRLEYNDIKARSYGILFQGENHVSGIGIISNLVIRGNIINSESNATLNTGIHVHYSRNSLIEDNFITTFVTTPFSGANNTNLFMRNNLKTDGTIVGTNMAFGGSIYATDLDIKSTSPYINFSSSTYANSGLQFIMDESVSVNSLILIDKQVLGNSNINLVIGGDTSGVGPMLSRRGTNLFIKLDNDTIETKIYSSGFIHSNNSAAIPIVGNRIIDWLIAENHFGTILSNTTFIHSNTWARSTIKIALSNTTFTVTWVHTNASSGTVLLPGGTQTQGQARTDVWNFDKFGTNISGFILYTNLAFPAFQ